MIHKLRYKVRKNNINGTQIVINICKVTRLVNETMVYDDLNTFTKISSVVTEHKFYGMIVKSTLYDINNNDYYCFCKLKNNSANYYVIKKDFADKVLEYGYKIKSVNNESITIVSDKVDDSKTTNKLVNELIELYANIDIQGSYALVQNPEYKKLKDYLDTNNIEYSVNFHSQRFNGIQLYNSKVSLEHCIKVMFNKDKSDITIDEALMVKLYYPNTMICI